MTGWIVLGCIVLALAAVLSVSGVLYVHLTDQGLSLQAGALGIRIPLFGPDLPLSRWMEKFKGKDKGKKPRKKKPKKPPKAVQKAAEQHPNAKRDMGEFVETLLTLVQSVFHPAVFVLHHLRFTHVRIWMRVGEEDADQTALAYAKAYSAAAGLLAVLSQQMTVKIEKVDISADFVRGETSQDISFRVKLRLGVAVWAGLCMIANFLVKTVKRQNPGKAQPPAGQPGIPMTQIKKEGN